MIVNLPDGGCAYPQRDTYRREFVFPGMFMINISPEAATATRSRVTSHLTSRSGCRGWIR